jgi:hypothetical protein
MRDAFGHVATHLLAARRRDWCSSGAGSGRSSTLLFRCFFGLFYFFSHLFLVNPLLWLQTGHNFLSCLRFFP